TDDLQSARVFYSVIGGEEEKERTRTVLKDSIPSIRRELAHTLNLRRTPSLFFVYDETPERANRVFTLLEKIHAEEPAGHPEPETAPEKPPKKKKTPGNKS
ncbi:MAG: ribosome-binding factor A, partial [Endomicrobiales bacterium]